MNNQNDLYTVEHVASGICKIRRPLDDYIEHHPFLSEHFVLVGASSMHFQEGVAHDLCAALNMGRKFRLVNNVEKENQS